MSLRFISIFLLSMSLFVAGSLALARTPVGEDGSVSPAQAEKEARSYFRKNPDRSPSSENSRASVATDEHYLAIHLGGFLNSDGYQWGQTPHVTNPGRLTAGVTYGIGSLSRLADWAIRADFIGYELPEGKPLQFTIVPLLMFPDSRSYFPLYFGIGAGPGVFFSQIQGESFLAFDYQLIGGVRFFNVIDSTGFFLETGLKNHILLLSDGQFNGFFLTTGALFTF